MNILPKSATLPPVPIDDEQSSPPEISSPSLTVVPKLRRDIRSAIEDVFAEMGGSDGMVKWITESTVNKRIFYKDILPKVIPRQVQGELSGPGGAPMKMLVEWQAPPQDEPKLNPAQAVLGIVTNFVEEATFE